MNHARKRKEELKAKPCPHCGRPGSECWIMPCLELSRLLGELDHGKCQNVNEWLTLVNAPFTVTPKVS